MDLEFDEQAFLEEEGLSFFPILTTRAGTTEDGTTKEEDCNTEQEVNKAFFDSFQQDESIFEEQVEGFPDDQLGELTFEEIREQNKPNPWLDEIPPCKSLAEEYQEEMESTLPGKTPVVQPPVYGCMDPTATNYNPSATVSDNSCTYSNPTEIVGCMDPTATNYNPSATVSDNSCIYSNPTEIVPQGAPEFTITNELSATEVINQQTAISQSVPSVTSQDPNGVGWVSWNLDPDWDGIPMDPTGKTPQQICDFISNGSQYRIKGLRQRFYEVNPFADNANPTPQEIENWNLEVIRHFRALLGNPTPVTSNARLTLEARWADERKRTQAWDVAYPDTNACNGGSCIGKAPGPCFTASGTPTDTAGGHCGDGFFPNPQDVAQYTNAAPYFGNTTTYPELANFTSSYSQATGGGSGFGVNADIPWSMKLAAIIHGYICNEGVEGHAGPYVGMDPPRTEHGGSWWPNSNFTQMSYRGKWH